MNIVLRSSFLLALLCANIEIKSIYKPDFQSHISWCKKIGSTFKNSAALAATTATTAAIWYYFLLPAATQTASSIGAAVIHETARVAEVAVEKTAPFGAGGFIVHYLMNEFGIQSHQGMGRAYAASLAIYLVRRQILMTLGI